MIYSLRGKLLHTDEGLAVIECGGVGYGCRTTKYTLAKICNKDEVQLFTYLHITENAVDLFGFADNAELVCFKHLISVSGVGPKAALSILSNITPSELALCIATDNSKALTKSPGIGGKTAQRIVLELKDKISKEQRISAQPLSPAADLHMAGNSVTEALNALAVLGFAPMQAQEALKGADPNSTVEELIKCALRNLGSKNASSKN